jgi:hypothetical protein
VASPPKAASAEAPSPRKRVVPTPVTVDAPVAPLQVTGKAVAIELAAPPPPALPEPTPGPSSAPRRSRRYVPTRSMALVIVSVIAAAEAVVIASGWYLRPQPGVADVASLVGTPVAASAAAQSPAAESEVAAPRTPVDVPSPSSREAGPTPSPVSTTERPPAAAAPGAAPRFGGMTVVAPIELQVWENGKRLGSTGVPIAVTEGVHTIDLVSEALAFRTRETITVKPGELATRTVAVPNGRLSINAAPWADVLVDGNSIGQTPLANVLTPIGEHQITFRHPQFGEQRQAILVKAEGVTRVSANMQR